MPEFLDIRFTFILRAIYEDSDGKNPIILRIAFRGKRSDLFTGPYCFKEDWDKSTDRVLKTDTESKTKKTLNSFFLEKFFYFLRKDRIIGSNTSMKYLSIVKSILTPAIKSGAIKGDPFSEKPKRIENIDCLTQNFKRAFFAGSVN